MQLRNYEQHMFLCRGDFNLNLQPSFIIFPSIMEIKDMLQSKCMLHKHAVLVKAYLIFMMMAMTVFVLHCTKVSCNNYVGTNKRQDTVNKLHAKSIMF